MNEPNFGNNHFNDLWQKNADKDFGWAFYRFPGEEKVNFMAGKVAVPVNEEKLNPAFIIAPFHSTDHKYWKIENTINVGFDNVENIEELNGLPYYYNPEYVESTSRTEYCNQVENILEAIEKQDIEKAVPARVKYIKANSDFSALAFYKSLLRAYPNAFVYMLSTPNTGTWIGCTPELLLNIRGQQVKTLSLAGTKKNVGMHEKDFNKIFTDKELNEQAIVTDYIRSILDKYIDDISVEGPELINAGNVYHLATYFKGELKASLDGNYGSLLNELHPTPAVCGFPLGNSLKLILEQEKFDRSLYSGFLGPVSANGADLYVNLRCMQVFKNSFNLYAGAGVVKGSVPEKEWQETEEKLNTLLKYL